MRIRFERVSDVDLVGSQSAALGPGRPITVHWMKGRSRSYAVGGRVPSAKSLLSLAFNDRCDAIVAIAVVEGDRASAQELAVLEFLNGDLVLRWAEFGAWALGAAFPDFGRLFTALLLFRFPSQLGCRFAIRVAPSRYNIHNADTVEKVVADYL